MVCAMHSMQQHILRELTLNRARRFGELKPSDIESNKFVYHLDTLKKRGLVHKHADSYRLTAAGKRFAERVSLERYEERAQPKVVTLVVLKNKLGQHLLYRRRRVPFMGLVGFPNGKMHLGERTEDAAARELKEKTGLVAEVSFRGSVYLCVHDEEELVTHMLAHVFVGRQPRGALSGHMPAGECFWRALEDVPTEERMPGVREILRLLSSGKKNFFAECFLDIHEP